MKNFCFLMFLTFVVSACGNTSKVLLIFGNPAFSQVNELAAPTETQIKKVISLLQSPQASVQRDTLEIIRGTEYLDDIRVQQVVMDLIGHQYPSIVSLAIEIIQELPGDPLPRISYVFSKTVQEKWNGGWNSWALDAGTKFISKYAGNNITLFRHFSIMMVSILGVSNSGDAAWKWTQIMSVFRGLGDQGSISEDFPILRQLLPKISGFEDNFLKAHFNSYESLSQTEQDELIRLFVSEEPNGWNDAALALRTLEWMQTMSTASLEQLRAGLTGVSKASQKRVLQLFRKHLKPGIAEHALLIEKLFQQSAAIPGLNEWIFETIAFSDFLSQMADPHAVITLAIDALTANSNQRYALILLARNSKFFQPNDINRLMSLLPNDQFAKDFASWMPKGDLSFLSALVNSLNSPDEKTRINAVMLIDAGMEFSKIDFYAENGRAQKLYMLFKTCSTNSAGEAKVVCARKVSEFDAYIVSDVTKFPLNFIFNYIKSDLLADGSLSQKVLSKIPSKADSKLRWSPAEFKSNWVPFLLEQFRSGNPKQIRTAWFVLTSFTFNYNGQMFWQRVPGDGIAETLFSRFLGGDNLSARACGDVLALFAYNDKTLAGTELKRTLIGLLNDSRQYVVVTTLQNLFYLKPLESATIKRILDLAKSPEIEVRAWSLNELVRLFEFKDIDRTIFDPLIPDLKKALLSSSLLERSIVVPAVASIPKTFPAMRDVLLPTGFLNQLIADFLATRERYLRNDVEASSYYSSFIWSFFGYDNGLIALKDVPVDFMLDMLASPNRNVLESTIRVTSVQQRDWCQQLTKKRCGVLQVGSNSGNIMITKKVLNRFADFAVKNPGSEQIPVIDYMINIKKSEDGRPPFSVLEYAAGKQTVTWDVE